MKEQQRIIICRHAESLEDVDNGIYDTLSDLDIPLTEKGVLQATELGKTLNSLLEGSYKVLFYTSPGARNKQTLELLLASLSKEIWYLTFVEPLLVKQHWGSINSENRPGIEEERYRTGVLRYTFPTGESAESLIKRLSLFKEHICALQDEQTCDIVILSHGFEFRVLLMLFFGWTEEYFESLGNLYNGEHRILYRQRSNVYILNEELRKHGLPITRLAYNQKNPPE
jgi:broad specificity phosphatase PhoE